MADYIDREAVINAIVGLTAYKDVPQIASLVESQYHYQNDWIGGIHDAVAEVNAIPAADVVPVVHGRWIEEDAYEYGENAWRCSACGEPYVLLEGTPKQNLYNYCPNCGCAMEDI